MIPASRLELLQPKSLKEALEMLRRHPPCMPIAGCTDVFVGFQFGIVKQTRFLNLWGLKTLRSIAMKGKLLSIGALATYTEIIRSPLIARRLPILIEAACTIGGPQIQNRGTIGGNIANASPAGDTLPVLIAADATLVLRNADSTRRIPIASFYTGYKKTAMQPDELIVAIEIPPIHGTQHFRKVGTRAAQAISKVVMAAVLGGPTPRIGAGSVAPTVIRCPKTEAAIYAHVNRDEIRRVFLSEIHPIDDIRSTAEYRRRVAANLLEQFLREASS